MAQVWYVDVIDRDTEEVTDRIGPMKSERGAGRVEDGMNINMNHDQYFTQIESEWEED